MIIVAGTMRTAPEHRDRVLEHAAVVMDATRQEDGCHEYVFTADSQESDLIRLYELWESDEHLAAHLKTPHIAAWRESSQDLVTEREISVFTVVDSRRLS